MLSYPLRQCNFSSRNASNSRNRHLRLFTYSYTCNTCVTGITVGVTAEFNKRGKMRLRCNGNRNITGK